MSTSLKSPDELKDAECKKGQLSHWPPITYVPMVDIVKPKEDPQVFKIKLPDRPTSACLITPMGTMRNTSHT